MIVQSHTPTPAPSTPKAPSRPTNKKPAGPKKPTKPSSPKPTQKPAVKKPTVKKPQKKSAALWDVEVDEPMYELPGLKQGGHIH